MNPFSKRPRSTFGKGGRREDIGMYVRSKMEANWVRYLNLLVNLKQIAKWEYEVDEFEFPVKRGCRFYKPDFKVTNLDGSIVYQETKGYMDQKSKTKLKRMAKYYPHLKVEVVDTKRYLAIAKQVAGMIKEWE